MKSLIKFLVISIILSGVVSCKKSSPAVPDPNITFKAVLSSANEVPVNASSATGNATLIFNSTTKIFTVTVTYTGLTAVAGHIHKAAAGISGPVIFPFSGVTSPITYTSAALDASQEADLNATLYYVNLHSSSYPGGEIRGQLIKQ